MKHLPTLARLLLGAIFLYAALDKIVNPAAFAAIVHNYKLLPVQLVNLTAIFLPWLEAVCGAALVAGVLPRGAATLTVLLMLVFMAALGVNLLRGIDVDCGCFGSSPGGAATTQALVRDAALLVLALYAAFSQDRKKPVGL